ncbi:MAG: VanW family protein, partial [Actinomycetia bacterium]|nr:VanW family protein [Actinomycetes bacterium]
AVWTAAFFAGMERASTRAHSVYISRYQPGLEATVAWGIFDMQFRNDSLYPVVITTDMTNSSMTVEFWGTKIYDEIDAEFGERNSVRKPKTIYRKKKDGCSPQSGIPGFTIDVDRVFYQNDEEVKRETIRSYYRAAPKVVCGKKPKKKDKDEDKTDEGTPQDAPAQDAPAGDAPAGDAPAGNSDDATPATDDGTFENVPAEEVDVG